MLHYHHYRIKHADDFNELDFPNVMTELESLKEGLSPFPDLHKDDIIISYAKDHHIENVLASDNPTLSVMITSGALVMSHLQWLFESCRMHKHFTEDFEKYIKKTINADAN
jgi:hypothetical protein